MSIPIGKLAFVTSESFARAGNVYIMSGQRRTPTLAYKTRELEFVSDGKRIIYCTNDSEAQGIYIYDLKEHASTPLLTNIAKAEAPSWSPDGTKIAFEVWQEGRKSSQIYTALLTNSTRTQEVRDA